MVVVVLVAVEVEGEVVVMVVVVLVAVEVEGEVVVMVVVVVAVVAEETLVVVVVVIIQRNCQESCTKTTRGFDRHVHHNIVHVYFLNN